MSSAHSNPAPQARAAGPSTSSSFATNLFRLGYPVIPVIPPNSKLSANSRIKPDALGKIPGMRNAESQWYGIPDFLTQKYTLSDVKQFDSWGANIGICAARFPALDIDVSDASLSRLVQNFANERLGAAPIRTRGATSRKLLVYRTEKPFARMAAVLQRDGKSHLVEMLCKDRQYVVSGTHPKGDTYGWDGRALDEWPAGELTEITQDTALEFFRTLATHLEQKGLQVEIIGSGKAREAAAVPQADLEAPSLEVLKDVVSRIRNGPPIAKCWDDYRDIAYGIKAAGGEAALPIFLEWCERWEQGTCNLAMAEDDWSRMHPPFRRGFRWLQELAASTDATYNPAIDEFEADASVASLPEAETPIETPLILEHDEPYSGALAIFQKHFTTGGVPTLCYVGGSFYSYNGTHHEALDDAAFRARIWQISATARRSSAKPFTPNPSRVNALVDAMKAVARQDHAAPCWLNPQPEDVAASDIVAMRNGLLHVPTRRLLEHTPRYYTHHSLNFNYDDRAPKPALWLDFLRQLWPEDEESIGTLQEMFGYFLTTDTSQQKLFLLMGPPRGGKGVLVRVINALLGSVNVSSPTLSSLATQFGLSACIGKMVATVSDAQLGTRVDQSAIAERILAVSGEDTVTIDRKFRDPWTGRLPTRFIIATNELPRIANTSGALSRRFIVLRLEQSFYGKEDVRLTEKLTAELTGILSWALEGLERLNARGHFIQPASSAAAIQDMQDLESPVSAFVRDRCKVGANESAPCHAVFNAWREWCGREGWSKAGTKATLGRDLKAVLPALKVVSKRATAGGEQRVRTYEGLGLLPVPDEWAADDVL